MSLLFLNVSETIPENRTYRNTHLNTSFETGQIIINDLSITFKKWQTDDKKLFKFFNNSMTGEKVDRKCPTMIHKILKFLKKLTTFAFFEGI